jgi:translation initiation factor eIF-2B subunit delta
MLKGFFEKKTNSGRPSPAQPDPTEPIPHLQFSSLHHLPPARRLSLARVSHRKPQPKPSPSAAMDLRRPPRSSSGGVEPKIRQVGFFTPDASAPSEPLPPAAAAPAPSTKQRTAAGALPAPDDLSPGRLSPVMIPPPRHADHLAPGPPSPAAADAILATSAPARSSARLDVASEIADDDSWSRAPSATELGRFHALPMRV